MSRNSLSAREAARRQAALQREKLSRSREVPAGPGMSTREKAAAVSSGSYIRSGAAKGAGDGGRAGSGSGYGGPAGYGDDAGLEEAVKLEVKRRRRNRRLVMTAAVLFMVVGLGYFAFYYFTADRTASMYDEATSLRNAARGVPTVNIHRTQDGEVPDVLEEYSLLYSTHRNTIGWLKIDDTVIDYPVMQLNNEFYLDHNYKGDKDKNGAIFMDESCDVLKPSDNIILYGHHMRSGNMFGDLNKYSSEEYGKAHSTIEFDTIYEKGTYQLMYVFQETIKDSAEITFKYYQFINANSAMEFDSNMAAMAAMSMYDTGVTASFGDKLLTLSTCDHSESNGRFVVVAKRVG